MTTEWRVYIRNAEGSIYPADSCAAVSAQAGGSVVPNRKVQYANNSAEGMK
jgi:hypothetical protein